MISDLGQIIRFGLVGLAASATHLVCALALLELQLMDVYGANTIAFGCALAISYFGHHRWTFRRDGGHRRHFPKFAATAVLGFVLNQAIIVIAIQIFEVPYWVGILVVVLIVPPIVYLLCRLWAFAASAAQPR